MQIKVSSEKNFSGIKKAPIKVLFFAKFRCILRSTVIRLGQHLGQRFQFGNLLR